MPTPFPSARPRDLWGRGYTIPYAAGDTAPPGEAVDEILGELGNLSELSLLIEAAEVSGSMTLAGERLDKLAGALDGAGRVETALWTLLDDSTPWARVTVLPGGK